MKNSQKTLWMYMKLYFTVFLQKQRNASQHTITACQDTWNLFLKYLSDKRAIRLEALGFCDIDSDTVVSFLDAMENERGWKPSTRNQRLSCIHSFLHYAACMEPTLGRVIMILSLGCVKVIEELFRLKRKSHPEKHL